jgi:hypothetical protein
MISKTRKKAADLAKEIEREVRMLENELAQKRELLSTLSQLDLLKAATGPRPTRRRRRAAIKRARPATRRRAPRIGGRRRSKNRDAVIAAASRLKGRFTLAQLREKIQEKEPRFGGRYPSGTILSVLKSTPEVKKVKRGTYVFRG